MNNIPKIILSLLAFFILVGVVYVVVSDKGLDREKLLKADSESYAFMQEKRLKMQTQGEKNNEAEAKYHGIACYGDLLTLGEAENSYPYLIDRKIEDEFEFRIPVENLGIRNENAVSVLARMGAVPLCIRSFKMNPSNQVITPVNVYADNNREVNILCGDDNPGINPVTLNNIEGILYGKEFADNPKRTEYFYFQRDLKGESVTIPEGTLIETKAKREYADYFKILWIGNSGGYSSLNDLYEQYAKFKEYCKDEKYIIIGMLSNGANISQYNKQMEKLYGDHFINTTSLFLTIDMDAVVSDSAVFAKACTDNKGILKPEATEALASCIYDRMKTLGFFETENTNGKSNAKSGN